MKRDAEKSVVPSTSRCHLFVPHHSSPFGSARSSEWTRRRPSAPSFLQHLESALTRRPSVPQVSPLLVPVAPSPAVLRPREVVANPSSAIALRRPSAVVIATQKTHGDQQCCLTHGGQGGAMNGPAGSILLGSEEESIFIPVPQNNEIKSEQNFDDTITVYLSAMYAKLLVFLGIVFPITETIALKSHYYQGFYLYLYVCTLAFLLYLYGSGLKNRAIRVLVRSYRRTNANGNCQFEVDDHHVKHIRKHRYGSFYLRLGAVAFGIGSMVYSGLEFGQYWEMRESCRNVTQALTPAARLVLTLVQMQFIFLNNRELEVGRHKVVSQFGLMHMIATNLCEWLTVIIEEAKHEIQHLPSHHHHHSNGGQSHHHVNTTQHDIATNHTHEVDNKCVHTNIVGTLVRNASPFLFPCTIEYSLICAVVLFEMWKNSHRGSGNHHNHHHVKDTAENRVHPRSINHLSVDCTKAHKGLFAGIVIVVLTIISLILFFVLNEADGYQPMSLLVVNLCELCLYVLTTAAVMLAFYQIRTLKHIKEEGKGLGLDNSLLVMAQTGVFMYCLFSIIAYNSTNVAGRGMIAEMCGLIQSICQTIFVLDSTRRRCTNIRQWRRKPGRQMVTFLLVANMAMWIVNTLEKSRAEFRPTHLEFYGVWPWTIITHISMPLAIFYRFHSTICLFEIWKSCYKFKLAPCKTDKGDSNIHSSDV